MLPKKKPVAKQKATRNRRSPLDILEDLKAKRQRLAEQTETRLARYDGQIERIERTYARKIAIDELRQGKTPEELQQEFEELKERQRLLKLAMK